ncbi:MAG: hypothetical protein E7379_01400 [Clostridiales bacterium]|nr:hypothetical protein [Clostridiales bacterium]
MFSSETNGYNRKEVDLYIARMKESYEKTLMEDRLKVLDNEKKILELKNKNRDIEKREKNIQNMLESFKRVQVEGSNNIENLRGEQLRIIYHQFQDFMQELNGRYPGVLVNNSYKKLMRDIESVLSKGAIKNAGVDNDPMRALLIKMQEKRESGSIREIKIERSPDAKERSRFIRPVTEMELKEGDGFDSLVDKFLASEPVEQKQKSIKQTSGFDLREAVTPTEDLNEIMKAFDFFGGDDEDKDE